MREKRLDRLLSDCTREVRSDQDRTGQVRSGQVRTLTCKGPCQGEPRAAEGWRKGGREVASRTEFLLKVFLSSTTLSAK